MSVHRNDLGTGIFSFEELLKFNPVQTSIQGGRVLNLDYRWNLKPYNNFQNNQNREVIVRIFVPPIWLFSIWYLFVSV